MHGTFFRGPEPTRSGPLTSLHNLVNWQRAPPSPENYLTPQEANGHRRRALIILTRSTSLRHISKETPSEDSAVSGSFQQATRTTIRSAQSAMNDIRRCRDMNCSGQPTRGRSYFGSTLAARISSRLWRIMDSTSSHTALVTSLTSGRATSIQRVEAYSLRRAASSASCKL